jgi:hypothetical protein
MVSSKAKGQKFVNEAIELYKRTGYTCWKPGNVAHWIAPGKCFSQSQDILEVADFIAVKLTDKVKLVQVTSAGIGSSDLHGLASARRKKFDDLNSIPINHVDCVVMARMIGDKTKRWAKWTKLYQGKWSPVYYLDKKGLMIDE